MGKRLLITEEEKNRIKSLYETTTPPPSESVLVANKNPFKDSEYVTARRVYTPKLQNGDLFFEIVNESKYREYASDQNSKMIDEFVSGIIGKTFRENDENYRIDDLKLSDNQVGGDGGSKFYNFTLTNVNNNQTYNGLMTILGYLENTQSKSTIRFHFKEKQSNGLYYLEPQKLNEVYSQYVITNCIQEKLDGFYSPTTSWLSINKIPDEYFEIRKIERQKTDY